MNCLFFLVLNFLKNAFVGTVMVDLQAKIEVLRTVISTINRCLMNNDQGVTAMRGVVEVINTVKKKSYIFQILVRLKKCQQAM